MPQLTKKQLDECAAYVEKLSHLRLVDRVLLFVSYAKARGVDAFARPAHYVAAGAGSSTTAQTYSLQLVRNDGILLLTEIEHPTDGTADILCTQLTTGADGRGHVDSSAVMDSWCVAESSEDPRELPWPIIVGAGDTLAVGVTGTNLPTTGILVRGFHVDPITSEVFRYVGELFVEGWNKTHAAAAVMEDRTLDRTFRFDEEITHVTAKETLTGDAARSQVQITLKGYKLHPKAGAVIPPKSLRKPGSRLSASVTTNDSMQIDQRYTSAGGAGTAKLQVTILGRRRMRQPDCAA